MYMAGIKLNHVQLQGAAGRAQRIWMSGSSQGQLRRPRRSAIPHMKIGKIETRWESSTEKRLVERFARGGRTIPRPRARLQGTVRIGMLGPGGTAEAEIVAKLNGGDRQAGAQRDEITSCFTADGRRARRETRRCSFGRYSRPDYDSGAKGLWRDSGATGELRSEEKAPVRSLRVSFIRGSVAPPADLRQGGNPTRPEPLGGVSGLSS